MFELSAEKLTYFALYVSSTFLHLSEPFIQAIDLSLLDMKLSRKSKVCNDYFHIGFWRFPEVLECVGSSGKLFETTSIFLVPLRLLGAELWLKTLAKIFLDLSTVGSNDWIFQLAVALVVRAVAAVVIA